MRQAGEAHRQAQIQQLLQEEREAEQRKKQLENQLLMQKRGTAALTRERQL